MQAVIHRQPPPSAGDSAMARESAQHLGRHRRAQNSLTVRVPDGEHDQLIELPSGAVSLLTDILAMMAAGRGVVLIPENAELTTVQAAEILNVSRPFLIKLLEAEVIPCRKVGRHRRIRMEDVMTYKVRIDAQRHEALHQLTVEAQADGLGY